MVSRSHAPRPLFLLEVSKHTIGFEKGVQGFLAGVGGRLKTLNQNLLFRLCSRHFDFYSIRKNIF